MKTYALQGDIFFPKTTIQPILHLDIKMPAIGKIDFSIEKRSLVALGKCPPFLTCEREKNSESVCFQVDGLCTLPFSQFSKKIYGQENIGLPKLPINLFCT